MAPLSVTVQSPHIGPGSIWGVQVGVGGQVAAPHAVLAGTVHRRSGARQRVRRVQTGIRWRVTRSHCVCFRKYGRWALGLTMIEMLVVFVLLGLVSTLLFQGTGFFATRYETVQSLHREGSVTGLQQHWFISTVQSLVPYGLEARRFRGNASSFDGITLQALAAEPGMPVSARWYIDDRDGLRAVVYREDPERHADGVEWTVLISDEPGLRFQYADVQGRWRMRWPVDDAPAEWLPRAIRLVSPVNGMLWIARVDASAAPVITDAEMR